MIYLGVLCNHKNIDAFASERWVYMRNQTRYFAVKLLNGGKLELIAFFSSKERAMVCNGKSNHIRPITMNEWKKIPKDMKA